MNTQQMQIANRLSDRFSQLPEVEAVAVAGSIAAGHGSPTSDIDLYVYPTKPIPAEVRLQIGREFSDDVQLVDFWSDGLEWNDPATNIPVDVIFFLTDWMQEQIDRVLVRHEAWLGYTTCFWHTVRVSQILFDRNGWFAKLQEQANQPYPDVLVNAIVSQNFPPLRDVYSSYSEQIGKSIERNDPVSLNHRIAAFLASYFDILFAINRVPHPGEKRLLDIVEESCSKYPANMRSDVTRLTQATNVSSDEAMQIVGDIVNNLETLLKNENFRI